MANNIGWGQGAINNSIGWGQGAVRNLISWGKSHLISYSNETNIAGGLGFSYAIDFQVRVVADLGTFESFDCMVNLLNNI